MNTEFRDLGRTRLRVSYPWGLLHRSGSRVLCADGVVRSLAYLAQTPDTFFSVPAAVRVRGRYITGYVTGEETRDGKLRAHVFRQHTHDREGKPKATPLPLWPATCPKFDSREMTWPEWEVAREAAHHRTDSLVCSVYPVEVAQ